MTEVSEKKDVQKLQRIVVDSLEDVKAQDISVFNTEHLSPLFERVIIASGTSNRQTKALAANVRDDVRDGGFGKPRIEGEENGEWIIVDCGSVVVHIMQPAIRLYYHLEEIWGDKEVKFGAAKRLSSGASPSLVKGHLVGSKPAPAAKAAAKKVPAEKATTEKVTRTASKPTRKPVAKVATKTPTRTAAKSVSKTPAKTASKTARKTAAKSVVKKVPIKKIVGKTASKTASKKAPTKRVSPPAKKAAKKSASR
jgi:ribosome-associated protein